jgi:hypothetical protein
MAKKPESSNGHDRLEDAIAILIQNHASFLSQMAETERRSATIQRENADRFARIEETNAAILRVLAEHSRMLERLLEALREKIGFKAQGAGPCRKRPNEHGFARL